MTYEVSVDDRYLLKGFTRDELKIKRTFAEQNKNIIMRDLTKSSTQNDFNFIMIKDGEKYEKVPFSSIIIITAERSYCSIQTTGKVYVLSQPMSEVAEKLTSDQFIRVGRSNIINLDYFIHIFGLTIYCRHDKKVFSITISHKAMDQFMLILPVVGTRKRVLNKKTPPTFNS